jgi:hypothetical protein
MIDDLLKPLWKGIADIDQQQEAAAEIEALRARVAKADELAERAQHVCDVLKADNGHAPVKLAQALAAYRATGGAA